MNHKAFAIFDAKARAYLPPFFLPEQGMAVRAFADCANDLRHNFGKHPEDYFLFQIGEYDDSSGMLTCLKEFVALGSGLQHRKPVVSNGQAALELEA